MSCLASHRFLRIRRTLIDVSCVASKRDGIALYRPGRWWLRWIPIVMGWFAWLPWPGKELFDCSEISADRRSLCEAKSLERCSDCSIVGGRSDCSIEEVWGRIEETIGKCRYVTIYLGNGSEKSKLTIKARLENGRDVIVKLGNTPAAGEAIRNEVRVLNLLREKSICQSVNPSINQSVNFSLQIPRVIGEVGQLGNWTWSVQTVLPRGKSPNQLQKEHFEFLAKLKELGISHGDFTPWNCAIVKQNKLEPSSQSVNQSICQSVNQSIRQSDNVLVAWDWEDAGPWQSDKDENWFRSQVKKLLGIEVHSC